MKCATCSAWTSVDATRRADDGYTLKRTRTCANGHRFVTFEVLQPIYRRSPPTVDKAVETAKARAERWRRNAAIVKAVKAGATHEKVAAQYRLGRQFVTKLVGRSK